MLRREFLALVASFAAASAAAKTALAAAKASPAGIADAKSVVDAVVECRSDFEQTLAKCLCDGSLYPLGVSVDRGGSYYAVYRPAVAGESASPEQPRVDAVLAMHGRGVVEIERVNIYNGYSGVEVVFSISTRERS